MSELAVHEVRADGSEPESWLAVLHGIYGAGRNWGSVARALVEARPDWGALLVDLRGHGGTGEVPGPHTLESAARDLSGLSVDGTLRAVLGHSFGGKVALIRGREDPEIRQVWVADSTPEAREPGGSAWEMLQVLRTVPDRFPDRGAGVKALQDEGVAPAVASWMTTNLEWQDDAYRWRIDLDHMEALLDDFFQTDLWDVVEQPRPDLELHFIRATGSSVLSAEAIERIHAAGQATGRVFLHEVQGGHWLNADNPDAVVELLVAHL